MTIEALQKPPANDIEYADASIIADNAKFINACGATLVSGENTCEFALCDSAVFENLGKVEKYQVYLTDSSSFKNAGELSAYKRLSFELCFGSGNTKFTNEESGKISFVGDNEPFSPKIRWSLFTRKNEELSSKNQFTGTFENRGTIDAGQELYLEFHCGSDSARDTLKDIEDFAPAGKLKFENAGTGKILGNVVADGIVDVTLVQGSNISGSLKLGKASEWDSPTHSGETVVRDNAVLNIVLSDLSVDTPLVSGDLTLLAPTQLTVSADAGSSAKKFSVQLWGGSLVLNSQTEVKHQRHSSGGNPIYGKTTNGELLATSGMFARGDENFIWTLDTATGKLTAESDAIGQEIAITDSTANVELGANDVAEFDASVSAYSGELSGAGQLIATGDLTFSGDAGNHTGLTSLQGGTFSVEESATLGSGDFSVSQNATLNLAGTRDFANELSGAGTLVSAGTITLSGDAGAFSGETKVDSGTLTVSESAKLGRGDFSVSENATLKIAGEHAFAGSVSGAGTVALSHGASVGFSKEIGVKNLSVANGATLRGNVEMEHGNAVLTLAGTLSLDVKKGEKVSLNAGTVVLENSANLELLETSQGRNARAASSETVLESGKEVVIFDGAKEIEGDVKDFLRTSSVINALAAENTVVYDAKNGLSVRVVKNASAVISGIEMHDGLGEDFLNAVLDTEKLAFGNGLFEISELTSDDPLVKTILTNPGAAGTLLTTLSPLSYAAMVAMPATTFHGAVRSIGNRLAARRGNFSESAEGSGEFFVQAQMTSAENDDGNDAPTFDFDTYGVLAGADFQLSPTLVAGIALGVDFGEAKIHNGGGKIESDGVRAIGFLGKTWEQKFFANAGFELGYNTFDVKRKTVYGNAEGDTKGTNIGVFADAGMKIELSEKLGISATPYVGFSYAHTEVGGFDDEIFDVDSFSGDSLRARIGCGIAWDFFAAGAIWKIGFDLAYSHDFLGEEVDISANDFEVTANALPTDLLSLGPVVNVKISETVGVFAAYTLDAGTDSSISHHANAGVRFDF